VIKINKPRQTPNILRTKGKAKRATLCRSYNQHRAEYENGKRTFNFDVGIYGHASVKEALIKAQHGKCCFCEAKVGGDGDVEHFRPKAASCQGKRQKIVKPGYYWLTYEWSNLLLSCSTCNQRYKKNYFPLAHPTTRARSHRDNIAGEEPLLINPTEQDPEQYISFRQEIPYSINDNPQGKLTIEILRLDREPLNEARRSHLRHIVQCQEIINLAASQPENLELQQLSHAAQNFIARSITDGATFAAMARAAQASNFYC